MTLQKYGVSALVSGIAILGLVALAFVAVAPQAQALSQSDVDLICAITSCDAETEAALQALVTGGTTTTMSYTFTRDLTTGSTGEDVRQLQMFLNNKGYTVAATGAGSVGNESTYFGSMTAAALAKFQAAQGISPAVGYFGPVTRSAVNGMMTTSTGSSTTTTTTTGLKGGAGSVDSYDLISSLNNEEVGEGEDDVEVAGIEIEVDDGSDIQLTAAKLVFVHSTNGSGSSDDFEDYASEVSLMLDGEEVARLDADEFDEDNDFTQTVTLDDAVIEADETGELVVAVSGINNLDSADVDEEWTVEFTQVRFRDATGASISEDPGTGTRTFSFEDFATATDAELAISDGDDSINDARTINVDDSDDTDNVELFSFDMEAEGDSDIEIKDVPVTVTIVGGEDVDDVVSTLYLMIDGEEVASESISSSATAESVVVFEDVDYVIDAGDEVEAVVVADINTAGTDFDEGTTIQVAFGPESAGDFEDEEGNDLDLEDITGTASSDAHALYDVGIMVSLVSVDEENANEDGSNNDVGEFTIKFLVEAFDGTVYVANTAAATSGTAGSGAESDGIMYEIQKNGTATTDGVFSAQVTASGDETDKSESFELEDGDSTTITLFVTHTNTTSGDSGIYRALLRGIGWGTANDDTYENMYTFDLDDYKTDPISLN